MGSKDRLTILETIPKLYLWLLIVALANSAPILAEDGTPEISYEQIYFSRMGDQASTTTLELISKLGSTESGWEDSTGGVYFYDLKQGKGELPKPGQILRVHVRICTAEGKMIGDTIAFREPQQYFLGGQLLPAPFEQALATMQVGGRRLIAVTEEAEMDFEVIVFPYHRDRPKRGDRVFYEVSLLSVRYDELRKAVRFE